MRRQELAEILDNFNYIRISFDIFKRSISKYREDIYSHQFSNQQILIPFNKRLNSLELNPVLIKEVIIKKDDIYYSINNVLFQIKEKYSMREVDTDCIIEAIDKLKNTRSLEEIIKYFPNFMYKDRLKQQISILEQNNNKIINKRNSIKKKIDPKSKRYHHQLNYVDKTHPICEDVKQTAKGLVYNELKEKHLTILNLILEYRKNDFKELSSIPNDTMNIINKNALNLFLALTVKNYVEKEEKDSNNYKAFMRYLKNYLNSNKGLVDSKYIVSIQYNNALGLSGTKRYKISAIVDFVEEETKEKDNNSIDKTQDEYSFFGWDPNGESREIKGYSDSVYLDLSGTKKRVLQEKIDYYNALGYEKLHIGQNSFEGYLGFELDNGIVIIDKIYVNSNRREFSTEDAAAYITTKEEFEKLSKMSRSECIEKINSKQLNAVRVYHYEGWEKIVTEKSAVLAKK